MKKFQSLIATFGIQNLLHCRGVIEASEKKKIDEYGDEFANLTRTDKWTNILTKDFKMLETLKSCIKKDDIKIDRDAVTVIPRIITNLHKRLSDKINMDPGRSTRVLLNSKVLSAEELCIMKGLCQEYPLNYAVDEL